MNSLAQWLVRYRLFLMSAGVCLGLLAAVESRRLDLDWDLEGMFPPGEPVVASYRKLQERFGGNDLCLIVYRDPELWRDPAAFTRLQQTSQRIREVAGVQSIVSLSQLDDVLGKLRNPLQAFSRAPRSTSPLLDPDDELAQSLAGVLEGYTHRRDSQYLAIACLLQSTPRDIDSQQGPSKHEQTLAQLQQIVQQLPAPATDGMVTGEPVMVAEGFRMVQRDGRLLGLVSAVLVSIVLLSTFRSIRWTLIPLMVIQWSILFTQAILSVLQLQLTMISSTLSAIITIIGVATVTHVLLDFVRQRRTGLSREGALTATLTKLIKPIIWACITGAIGFAALLSANVGPVRDFGLMMAVGSASVLFAIGLLVPGLALLGKIDVDPHLPALDHRMRDGLQMLLSSVLRHRRIALIAILGLVILSVVGASAMQVETDFTKNFHDDSEIVRGYSVIERELGGAGVWDIMLAAPRTITGPYLQQVTRLEERLRRLQVPEEGKQLQLTKVISIVDVLSTVEADDMIGAIPVVARLRAISLAIPELAGTLLTSDDSSDGQQWLRIMLRSREQAGAQAKNKLITLVEEELVAFTVRQEWLAMFAPDDPPRSEVVGYHIMLGKLVDSVLADQWRCFAVAALGIYIAISIATRSAILGLIAMVPNALPILVVLGTLGLLGTKANMGVAMIAAVSLGLSIDSSIHYLLHYQRERRRSRSVEQALRSAQSNVGLALVLATIALLAGFLSLSLSEFLPTVVFGTLASLTMLGGLIGNLVALPVIIAATSAARRRLA